MSRTAAHPIDPMFLARWSPRAMSGAPLDLATLNTLFEAARWAPSAGNSQPWRFVYALEGTPAFAVLHGLLADGNKPWCARAGALLVVVSKDTHGSWGVMPNHSFDTGSAWMSLALQASRMGLVAHGMGGFDRERARTELSVPAEHTVECMVALGHPGPIEELPEPYRAREKPSDRNPVESFTFEGRFPAEK